MAEPTVTALGTGRCAKHSTLQRHLGFSNISAPATYRTCVRMILVVTLPRLLRIMLSLDDAVIQVKAVEHGSMALLPRRTKILISTTSQSQQPSVAMNVLKSFLERSFRK